MRNNPAAKNSRLCLVSGAMALLRIACCSVPPSFLRKAHPGTQMGSQPHDTILLINASPGGRATRSQSGRTWANLVSACCNIVDSMAPFSPSTPPECRRRTLQRGGRIPSKFLTTGTPKRVNGGTVQDFDLVKSPLELTQDRRPKGWKVASERGSALQGFNQALGDGATCVSGVVGHAFTCKPGAPEHVPSHVARHKGEGDAITPHDQSTSPASLRGGGSLPANLTPLKSNRLTANAHHPYK